MLKGQVILRRTTLAAVLGLLPGLARADNGPIGAGDNILLYDFQLNYLTAGSSVQLNGSSGYFETTDHDDSYGKTTSGTGVSTDTHGPAFNGGVRSGLGASDAMTATAGGPNGILRAGAFSYSGAPLDGSSDAQAFSTAYAIVGDNLHLSAPGNISLSGLLDGGLYANSGVAEASSAMSVKIYIVDPSARDENGQYLVLGGYRYDASADQGIVGYATDISQALSGSFDLPAGNYFFYAELYTTAVSETHADAAYAYSDFSHTLSFGLTAPDGTLTSDLGAVPINVVPEPGAATLAALPLAVLGRRRRG